MSHHPNSTRANVLALILGTPGLSANEAKELMEGVPRSTVAAALSTLHKDGYLDRASVRRENGSAYYAYYPKGEAPKEEKEHPVSDDSFESTMSRVYFELDTRRVATQEIADALGSQIDSLMEKAKEVSRDLIAIQVDLMMLERVMDLSNGNAPSLDAMEFIMDRRPDLSPADD